MQALFRQLLVVSAAISLIFCCSCERHNADELAHGEEHGESHAADDAHATGKHEDHDHAPARPAPTPVQFFPETTPH